MFIRLTDGRVAYTDNANFFFILTEPFFRSLLDPASARPDTSAASAVPGSSSSRRPPKPGLES